MNQIKIGEFIASQRKINNLTQAALAEKLGIKEVAQVGDTFDPNCHEAVMHIEDENLAENTIAAVLQKGYKIGDTVIRPAMVSVAN